MHIWFRLLKNNVIASVLKLAKLVTKQQIVIWSKNKMSNVVEINVKITVP